jgi:GT2 family glycosyltransferase
MIDRMNHITIALTRYQEPDDLFHSALGGIVHQDNVRAGVHVLDQSYHPKTEIFCKEISSSNITFLYKVIPARGCAYARNVAINLCKTDILLWTDPDVVLQQNWAYVLSSALSNPERAVVGGKIIPDWQCVPRWYMKTNIMKDHYSLIDLGDEEKETDRIIGGSMGIHIRRLGANAHFDERLGRQKGTLLGGVDAEFCQRIIRAGWKVFYIGQTTALHQIPQSRMNMSWIVKKFYYGGISRGLRGGMPSPMNKKRKLEDYAVLLFFSPFYLAGLLMGIVSKNKYGLSITG